MPSTTKKKIAVKEPVKQAASEGGEPRPAVAGRETPKSVERYLGAIGRRKTSVARVRLLTKGDKEILVNNRAYNVAFPQFDLQEIILAPLKLMNCLDKFGVSIRVKGGGAHSQAEAIRHGIARTLVLFSQDFRKRLKKAGYLTRDSRMRERKKFGLKRARRAPQWRKR